MLSNCNRRILTMTCGSACEHSTRINAHAPKGRAEAIVIMRVNNLQEIYLSYWNIKWMLYNSHLSDKIGINMQILKENLTEMQMGS